ncbi:MAG: NUDIX domain-containing protein [Micromonosporaceae bacterium]|nr:NUDIX domain-containing protein [Micromonosporaceae bacterium]
MAYTSVIDVLLLLIRDNQVLLALRSGTGFADGWWNVPSGKPEEGEDAAAAMIREAREEIGLLLDRDSLALASTMHYRNEREIGRLGLFFQAWRWDGEPVNAEPHKCAQIAWFPLDALPDRTYPYTRIGIELYRTGQNFAANGWER